MKMRQKKQSKENPWLTEKNSNYNYTGHNYKTDFQIIIINVLNT